ncbi:MAG: restriction endonuclease subunit S [Alphaproteobacteria bacterium]
MSADWKEDTLDNLTSRITDGSHQSPKAFEAGLPMYSVKDMREYGFETRGYKTISQDDYDCLVKQGCKPDLNDILIAKDGSVMKHVFVVKKDISGVLLSSIAIVKPDLDLVDPDFLSYFLKTPVNKDFILSNYVSGAGVPRIVLKDFKKVLVRYPEKLNTQKSIASILLTLDNKIELNRQTNQTLEEMAQAVFKSWFVDFEPTRAKIAAKENGKDPERAAMATIAGKTIAQLNTLPPEQLELLKSTAALFPDTLTNSELGDIPSGWDVKPLSSWGDIVCGKTPPKKNKEYYGGNVPFIKIPDMHGNMYAIKTTDSLTTEGANTQKKKIIPKGSVCVSCIATVGQVLIACENSATNQQINSIVPNNEIYTPYLYFSMLGSYDHLHDLASGGSATLNLNTGNFSKIDIAKPEDPVLQHFHDLFAPTMANILSNHYQNQTLKNLRDTLLPKLLSGEIDVSAHKKVVVNG